ncbi:MAG: ABC transporter permease [Deltaproteobacteria bacterium]
MSPIQGLRPEKLRELVLLILIALVLIVFSSVIENYLNARLFNRVSASVALMAVLAIGQTMVVLTRNIDLSVGSIVGFTAYFVGHQLSQYGDMHPMLAIFLAVGVGTLMGGINGILVAYCRIPSIIVTLGTMALYRTLLVEYSDAQTVLTVNLPRWLLDLPSLNLISYDRLHLRVLVVGMIVVVILFQIILKYTSFGRKLYAIGSNPEAAKMAGFANQRMVLTAFLLCGALAGLTGFMFLARFGNITGGVNIFGGSGSAFGAFLGAVLIDLLENSLIRWLQISEFWRDALLGLLILISVATDSVIMKRFQLYWARKQARSSPET